MDLVWPVLLTSSVLWEILHVSLVMSLVMTAQKPQQLVSIARLTMNLWEIQPVENVLSAISVH